MVIINSTHKQDFGLVLTEKKTRCKIRAEQRLTSGENLNPLIVFLNGKYKKLEIQGA